MSPDQRHTVELSRSLGFLDATMIGVGAMIGAGIFVLTGLAIGRAGPAAILAFALNGIVTLFTALSYAELASSIPEAGGGYAFVKKVLPNWVAFVSGWMLWFAYIVACSLYARGFGSYLLEFLGDFTPGLTSALENSIGETGTTVALTTLIAVAFLALNIVGTHATGKAENVVTLAKIGILSVFIAFGLFAVAGHPGVAVDNWSPFLPVGAAGVFGAMGLIFIAFEGYDLIATVSEEVKDPKRNIPKAILASLGITVLVYMLVVFVTLAAVPPEGGVPTWQAIGDLGETGIIGAARAFMPSAGVFLVLVGGIFATLSALNATIMASSRVAFAMGRDWMLPHELSRLHAARRTPVLAITTTGILLIAIAAVLPLETIGAASSLFFLLTFCLVNYVLIVYRGRSTNDDGEIFRIPFFPLTPLLGIVTTAGLAVFLLLNDRQAAALAGIWVVAGIVVFFVFFRRRVAVADVGKGIETPGLLDLKRTAHFRVVVPIANPERIGPLLSIAADVAKASKGDVLALRVLQLPDITSYADGAPLVDEAEAFLTAARRQTVARGVSFASVVKVGRSIGDEIVSTAVEYKASLILLGYKGDEDALENSIIHHVVTRQPCDVAVLKSYGVRSGPFRRVLLPLGGRALHDRMKSRLAHSLVDHEDGAVTFMSVVSPDAGSAGKRRTREVLERAGRLYGFPTFGTVVTVSDDVAGSVVEEARKHDLVILGMRGEPFLRTFFFGAIAHEIATRVECPSILTKTGVGRRPRLDRRRMASPQDGDL
jgi:amino acid transporter/nucleotide-binding universal stress UspA family protein